MYILGGKGYIIKLENRICDLANQNMRMNKRGKGEFKT